MTGPEHYRKAEELLELAETYRVDGAHATAAQLVTAAQVHATLAQAAATGVQSQSYSLRSDWHSVAA